MNEEGTEAAASTAVVMGGGAAAAPHEPIEFRADHPFLFVIHTTGSPTVLFIGRLAEPR